MKIIVERFKTLVISKSLDGESTFLNRTNDKCLVCQGLFDGSEWFIEREGKIIGAFCSGKCSAKYRQENWRD